MVKRHGGGKKFNNNTKTEVLAKSSVKTIDTFASMEKYNPPDIDILLERNGWTWRKKTYQKY